MSRRTPLIFKPNRRVNPWSHAMPDDQQVKMCFGKRQMNKQQALQAAAHMRKTHGATATLGPYKCRVCRFWHIGNDHRKDAA